MGLKLGSDSGEEGEGLIDASAPALSGAGSSGSSTSTTDARDARAAYAPHIVWAESDDEDDPIDEDRVEAAGGLIDASAPALSGAGSSGSSTNATDAHDARAAHAPHIIWGDIGEEVEEGLYGLVPWPSHIPRTVPSPGHGSKVQPMDSPLRDGARDHDLLLPTDSIFLGRRRQRALRAVFRGSADEGSTTMDDLSSLATFSSADSFEAVGSFGEEPSVAEKRHVVSL